MDVDSDEADPPTKKPPTKKQKKKNVKDTLTEQVKLLRQEGVDAVLAGKAVGVLASKGT